MKCNCHLDIKKENAIQVDKKNIIPARTKELKVLGIIIIIKIDLFFWFLITIINWYKIIRSRFL